MSDMNDPDCGPLPPDDDSARRYMRKPFSSRRQITFWDEKGELAQVDDEQWLSYLPKNENDEILVDRQLTVDLALLHNRDYQSQVEALHTQALGLSSDRFEFMVNWLGGTDTSFFASGDGLDATRDLTQSTNLGMSRAFATGGQFVANLANTFSWQLGGGGNSNFSSGNLVFSLTQPLLRGAFRHVRTELLTQNERSLLYSVRGFAQFRRGFYLDFVSQYYNLLQQIRSVEIEKENLANLERNLEELNLLFELQNVSRISVDQVFQTYQSARLALISSEQSLETDLDQFKFALGLPARVPVKLDESFLDAFRLNSDEVEELDVSVRELAQLMNSKEYLPPMEAPSEFLDEVERKIREYARQVEELKPSVDDDLNRWIEQLESFESDENTAEAEKVDQDQQGRLAEQMEVTLKQLQDKIDGVARPRSKSNLDAEEGFDDEDLKLPVYDQDDAPAVKRWKTLREEISKDGGLADKVATLFVSQAQCRLFLIEINPLKIEEGQAVEIALRNRLDLKNSKAQVVDAYRQVEIAGNGLLSDLDVSLGATLNTDPNRDNPLRFDSEANTYNVGVAFDGPLNRFNERNSYRIAQLGYQQQRRAYMALEDSIVNAVRLNLRTLRTSRFNFQIARQSLITATRQVEQAQLALRAGGSTDTSSTQDLLNALTLLRDNKNSLISSWFTYEIARISVFVDLELLELDENGVWTNDRETIDDLPGGGLIDADEIGSQPDESEDGEATSNVNDPTPADADSEPALEDVERPALEPVDPDRPVAKPKPEPDAVKPPGPKKEVPLAEPFDFSCSRDGRRGGELRRV